MKAKDTAVAYIVLVIYAVMCGFAFLCAKVSVGIASPLQTLAIRFALAFLGGVAMLASGRFAFSLKGGTKEDRRHLFITMATYVGFLGIQAWGLLYATSIVSGILFAAVPVLARLVSGVVLKEGSTWVQNAFAALSVGAVMAMFIIGAGDSLRAVSVPGFLLLLAASVCCAVSNVYMRLVKPRYSPFTISFCSCTLGCGIFAVMAFVKCLSSGDWAGFFAPVGNLQFMAAVAYLGIGCTLITATLISFALRTLPAMSATIFGNLSTAISVVAGAVVLSEPLYGYQLVCTALIILGVLGVGLNTKTDKPKE